MRVLVAAMPFAGHVSPMAAVASAFVQAGHEVLAYTGTGYGSRFTAVGATWVPWHHAPDFDDADIRATFPKVGDGRGPRAVATNLEHVFLRTGAGQERDIREAGPVDVLVSDQLAIGSSLSAERTGTAFASVALVPLGLPSRDLPPFGTALLPARGPLGRVRDASLRAAGRLLLERRLDRVLAEVRTDAGLPSGAVSAATFPWSRQLVLAHGIPDLEYPRSDLPRHVHFVGRLSRLSGPGGARPDWWDEALQPGPPVVHVTQGTYDVEPGDLLLPALAGLADEPVRVLAATGSAPLQVADVPGNAHQAAFLPYDDLLPRTSVMVTNGGWGGVLAALPAGVPLIVAGGTLDKPEIARRIAWSGTGVDLRTGRPRPAQVRAVEVAA